VFPNWGVIWVIKTYWEINLEHQGVQKFWISFEQLGQGVTSCIQCVPYSKHVHEVVMGWLGPWLFALLEELYVFSREFPLEAVPLNLQLTEFVISWHTCKATFLASSGTWKPSCSRYFVSIMINPNSGAKSAKYCKLGCEAETKSKVLGCLLWFTENDASLTCQLTALSKSLHYFYN